MTTLLDLLDGGWRKTGNQEGFLGVYPEKSDDGGAVH